jgi:SAM-dependent methyltransferase
MARANVAAPSPGACWVCGCVDSSPYKPRNIARKLVAEDLRISDANYGLTLALRRCRCCGFVFAEAEELGELLQLYTRLEDPDYEQSQDARATQMNWLLDRLEYEQRDRGSLLDVGAASGLLVHLAQQRGWHSEGVEPSLSLIAAARQRFGVELLQGSIPHAGLRRKEFNAVLMIDVLEHVADPRALLDAAKRLLAPGGCLMVVTPDLGSLARRLLGPRWWHFRLAHVGYFDKFSFALIAKSAGLEVTRQFRAKWFFRVSYLVERFSQYLPTTLVSRVLGKSTVGRYLPNLIVPLNLFDSWVFMCRRSP